VLRRGSPRFAGAAIAAAVLLSPLTPTSADSTSGGVTTVSAAMLENVEQDPGAWLVYGRDLGGQRFSPAKEIDASTIGRLTTVWTKTLGPGVSMEGTPIVAGGVMFVTTGKNAVFALDAKSGKTLWSYAYPLPASALPEACCNSDNRGVTLINDEVIFGTIDAHLVALDMKTGKVRWNVKVAHNPNGYAITSPPLPVKNMVITGVGGGEYPTRGFIAAYDAANGKQLWKQYTIPGPDDEGSDTWKIAGTATRGGGPTWLPGTYDPKSDTLYWGTGNPNPDFDALGTSGDLLYTSGLLALDPNTGAKKWFYQFTPHNIWDYDGVNEPMLVDVPIDGATVHAIAHADRNGYLYLLNRDTGKLIYAEPFLDKVTWGKVDRTTGKITFDPAIMAAAKARRPYTVYPSIIGGKNWEPDAYDPDHHILFIPALESSIQLIPDQKSNMAPKAGAFNFGGGFAAAHLPGSLSAWDLTSGKRLWKRHFRSPAFSGALATGGGIVFIGQMDGELQGYDELSGKLVWQKKTPSGITAPPMSYTIDGRQYVSVEVGIGGVVPMFFMSSVPWLKDVPKASMVYTYALPDTAAFAK
jgi:PQQ-dependent dehydrogenase (methanol/ethanol family)